MHGIQNNKYYGIIGVEHLCNIHKEFTVVEVRIDKYNDNDVAQITKIWNDIIDEGTSFHWEEHFSIEKVKYVLSQQTDVYCAYVDNNLVGFYLLHPNSSGRCKHIANAMYAVDIDYRRNGVGTKLIKHSLDIAKTLSFIAMQYNSVVESNPSIKIYERLGFERIGATRNGFRDINGNYSSLIIFYKLFEN